MHNRKAEWRGWDEDMPVEVVTMRGTEVFKNLADAKRKYPMLDPRKNTRHFTWAMKGLVRGRDAIRFEDWETSRLMSMAASVADRHLGREASELTAASSTELSELPWLQDDLVQHLQKRYGMAPVEAWDGLHGFIVSFKADANRARFYAKDLKTLMAHPAFRWVSFGRTVLVGM